MAERRAGEEGVGGGVRRWARSTRGKLDEAAMIC